MNRKDDQPQLGGKPPKSADEIRSVLTAIHNTNARTNAGHRRKAATVPSRFVTRSIRPTLPAPIRTRDAKFYRRLLRDQSKIIGAVAGGLIVANIAFATACMLALTAVIPLLVVLGLLIGSFTGIAVARHRVIQKRVDLFGQRAGATPWFHLLRCACAS